MVEVKNVKCEKKGTTWVATGEVEGKPIKPVTMPHGTYGKKKPGHCTKEEAQAELDKLYAD
ncbi:hypothetical protein [Vibrio parahaemolyticus]|uniref:hypothetical protein n=1 Tax=Vibrio parahaemolyticus TaxID=670 RepID=UPI000F512488|nr:hypothetical protein [Vibrio parahaemolyticus]RPB33396.1 hypothetical protein CYQ90_21565 [Vibrio parahaemolyticus]